MNKKWAQTLGEQWKKLVARVDTSSAKKPAEAAGADPFVNFLNNELAFGMRLVQKITADIDAIVSQTVLPRDLLNTASALEQGLTPER